MNLGAFRGIVLNQSNLLVDEHRAPASLTQMTQHLSLKGCNAQLRHGDAHRPLPRQQYPGEPATIQRVRSQLASMETMDGEPAPEWSWGRLLAGGAGASRTSRVPLSTRPSGQAIHTTLTGATDVF